MRRQESFLQSIGANQNWILYTQDYDQLILRLLNITGTGTFTVLIDGASFSIPIINAVAISASSPSNTYVFTRNAAGSFPQPTAGQAALLLPLSNFLVVTSTVAATLTITASAQV